MYKEAFWILIFVTVISMALQTGGYIALETVIFLVVMDFIAMWIYLENRKSSTDLNNAFIGKIDNLERTCSSISDSIGAVSSVLNLEEKVNRQREDIENMLQGINEKSSALEERLNGFGELLSRPSRRQEEVEERLETY
jgi:ABC-type protease/lipase transport system fused ATPase/permease subunit